MNPDEAPIQHYPEAFPNWRFWSRIFTCLLHVLCNLGILSSRASKRSLTTGSARPLGMAVYRGLDEASEPTVDTREKHSEGSFG